LRTHSANDCESVRVLHVLPVGGRLWDELLSFKMLHMVGLQALSRLMSHHGRGANPAHSVKRTPWLIISVLNIMFFARHSAEMGLVGACDGDWVMKHLKEMDINLLAKFCNLFHPF